MTKLTTEPLQEVEKEPTPEEVEKMRQNMIEYYKTQITVLEPQAEYEKLMADIEENRLRRVHSMLQRVQLQSTKEKPEERKLKTT